MSTTDLRVWIGCLACYNEGLLSGEWYDADQADEVTIGDVCGTKDEDHEELWVFDHEGFGPLLRGECAPATAYRLATLVDELDDQYRHAFGCYLELAGMSADDESLSAFEDAYRGRWDSEVDYAKHYAEETDAMPPTDAWPIAYVDWDQAAEDLFQGLWTDKADGGGVHVFDAR
jgi:antirestriction protein